MQSNNYKLAVDTGGTFTDICLLNQDTGQLVNRKLPSTPQDPCRAIMQGIKSICSETGNDISNIIFFLHGTTAATNALIEGKGGPAGLVTTRGFKDILYIGRQDRPHLYNFKITRSEPLVQRHMIFEAAERTGPGGEIITPLNMENAREIAHKLKEKHIKSAAICFLHSYANPEHERMMAEIICKEVPGISITLSSDILPEFREYERLSTTVINAMVQPVIRSYLVQLQQELQGERFKGNLFIMQSNGGVISASQAASQSARTVLSGPAAGVLAGKYISGLTGRENIITADMGGTSMDMSLISRGKTQYTNEGHITGHPLRLPMLDIHTLGAGGGSTAWIDPGGILKVGPHSAGADPGPACYGKGGTLPTVTDANVVLGRLSINKSLSNITPDPEAAQNIIKKRIANPLDLTVEEAAEGVIKVVNAGMIRSMHVISTHKGHDPREFTLMAFGGAGPLHAVELARELGAPHVLIPPFPGVTSAYGMLSANVKRDYIQGFIYKLETGIIKKINEIYRQLEEKALNDLAEDGFIRKDIMLYKHIDLHYTGQSYEITMEMPAGTLIPGDLKILKQSFHQAHNQQYGYMKEKAEIEVVAIRLDAIGKLPSPACKNSRKGSISPSPTSERAIIYEGKKVNTPVYERNSILKSSSITGPAVIEQEDSTALLWPGNKAHSDSWGNLIIDLEV